MKIEVNHLGVEIEIVNPRIARSEELEARVRFTNQSDKELILNGLFLNFGTILLEVKTAEGVAVPFGPPPSPPVDDGKAGRVPLEPRQSTVYRYHGATLFAGRSLTPGRYLLRFRYDSKKSANADPREWEGSIDSDWLAFEIAGDVTSKNVANRQNQ